jgi:hypothetical protein
LTGSSTELAPASETAAITYPTAHVIEPGRGDEKRGARLRAAIDAVIRAGDAQPDAVVFISARFWIIQRDGKTYYVHLPEAELEWLPIEPPRLFADTRNRAVKVNAETTLRLTDSDFLIVRPLVRKARLAMMTR